MKRLILCAALALPMASCNVEDYATPEQLEQIELYDARISDLDLAMDNMAKSVRAMQQDALDAVQSGDAQAMAAMVDSLTAKLQAFQGLQSERQELVASQAEIEAQALQGPAGSVQVIVKELIPDGPWKLALLSAIGLGTRLATKRGRRHVGNAAKHTLQWQFGSSAKSLLAALGFASGDQVDALESARQVALANDDPELAALLKEALKKAGTQAK